MNPNPSSIHWSRLLPGLILTAIVALSVHVVMIQGLDIPYPVPEGRPAVVPYARMALSVLALSAFFLMARPSLPKSLLPQALVIFLLDAGLRESVRVMVMEGVCSTAYGYAVGQGMGRLLPLLIRDLAVVLATAAISRRLLLAPVLLAVAAAVQFWLQPYFAEATPHLLEAIGLQPHDDVYDLPYGLHVLIPAYITFLEPAVCCLIMAALVRPRFVGRSTAEWLAAFALLILLIRGTLALVALDSFYLPHPLWLSLLSTGQFGLETLTLAVCCGALWRWSARQRA